MGAECSAHVKDEKKFLPTPWRHGESRDTAPLIHNLDTRWTPVVNLTTRMLYPGIHWLRSWVGPRAGPKVLQKKLLPPPGYRLNCPGCWKIRHLYKTVVKSEMSDTSTILQRILEYDITWHEAEPFGSKESNDWLMWKCYWSVRCNKTME